MKNMIFLFENVKDRLDDARKCMIELVPCQAKRTKDNTGLFIKKEYDYEEEYKEMMKIKEKYGLKIETFL